MAFDQLKNKPLFQQNNQIVIMAVHPYSTRTEKEIFSLFAQAAFCYIVNVNGDGTSSLQNDKKIAVNKLPITAVTVLY